MRNRREMEQFDRLLLTNKVEWTAIPFQGLLKHLQSRDTVPAIITVQVEPGHQGRHVIIDGNNRAVAHAYLKRPVRYFPILSAKDIDAILEIEARGGFSGFPHRPFLKGDASYKKLVQDAIMAAAHGMNGCTAQQKADEFRREKKRGNVRQ